jgi:hypothetical protein
LVYGGASGQSRVSRVSRSSRVMRVSRVSMVVCGRVSRVDTEEHEPRCHANDPKVEADSERGAGRQ